jgi:hypothetical protein
VAPRVCVATLTWARDDDEEARLRRSLPLLADSALTVVVSDRGTSPTFTRFLSSDPRFRMAVPRQPGLVAQVQASVAAAVDAGADFILYTESDKEHFFKTGIEHFLRAARLDHRTGAVLAARSDASYATFPPLQRFTEGTINELCRELIGPKGDYSYGPFLLNAELAPALADLPADAGWGWRHFMFGSAARRGSTLEHVIGDYPCPVDQRQEDEADRLHRVKQLAQNVQGLLLSIAATEKARR